MVVSAGAGTPHTHPELNRMIYAIRRMKELEAENARIKRQLANLYSAAWSDRDGLCVPDMPGCMEGCPMRSTCGVLNEMG